MNNNLTTDERLERAEKALADSICSKCKQPIENNCEVWPAIENEIQCQLCWEAETSDSHWEMTNSMAVVCRGGVTKNKFNTEGSGYVAKIWEQIKKDQFQNRAVKEANAKSIEMTESGIIIELEDTNLLIETGWVKCISDELEFYDGIYGLNGGYHRPIKFNIKTIHFKHPSPFSFSELRLRFYAN